MDVIDLRPNAEGIWVPEKSRSKLKIPWVDIIICIAVFLLVPYLQEFISHH